MYRFDCEPQGCILQSVSQCNDQVNKYICNAHASWFGLIYKTRVLETCSGIREIDIVAYPFGESIFSLPSFINNQGVLLTSKIDAFATAIKNKQSLSNQQGMMLKHQLEKLCGISTMAHEEAGWIERASLMIKVGDRLLSWSGKDLPPLHKYLFENFQPSYVTALNNQYSYTIENVCMYQDELDTHNFRIISPDITFKYTGDSVASPLVLAALTASSQNVQNTTFERVMHRTVV